MAGGSVGGSGDQVDFNEYIKWMIRLYSVQFLSYRVAQKGSEQVREDQIESDQRKVDHNRSNQCSLNQIKTEEVRVDGKRGDENRRN